jgi:hypothetical protein
MAHRSGFDVPATGDFFSSFLVIVKKEAGIFASAANFSSWTGVIPDG